MNISLRAEQDSWYRCRKPWLEGYTNIGLVESIDISANYLIAYQSKISDAYAYERGRFLAGYANELMRRFPDLSVEDIQIWVALNS
jgi:hypothetical protein